MSQPLPALYAARAVVSVALEDMRRRGEDYCPNTLAYYEELRAQILVMGREYANGWTLPPPVHREESYA